MYIILNKNLDGFVIIDSLMAIILITLGILFYIECDQSINNGIKHAENHLIESRKKYENNLK